MSDMPGVQEKVQDIHDLEHRLLANLYGDSIDSADYSKHIVIADNIFPSELVKLWIQKAQGLVSVRQRNNRSYSDTCPFSILSVADG